MLSSLKTYVYDRRIGLTKTAGFVGGLYITKRYITDRLEEVKDRLDQERASRDNLKRRFQQTQDDVSYTVLALLPTLAEQILDNMDVEALTQELQHRSRSRITRQHLEPPSSMTSSIEIIPEQEVRSDIGSTASSVASTAFSLAEASESGAQSVVEVLSQSSQDPMTTSFVTAMSNEPAVQLENSNSSLESSRVSDNFTNVSEPTDTRTKGELWNEVKLLTVTRTLTTLYSVTLLCLLSTIQLSLLARSKYVHSVLQQEHDERVRELLESELTFSKILLGGGQKLEKLMAGDLSSFFGEEDAVSMEELSEDAENKFLTLSWWLLHVGSKDVGERVRRGVEEVFDRVSLKTKLSIMDFHRLVSDVRRRVEHEVTFEGSERRINFLSTLLPPTPEMTQHVLTQGGFPSQIEEITTPAALAFDSSTSLSSQLSRSNYFLSAPQNNDPLNLFTSNSNPNPSLNNLHLPNPHPHTEDIPFTSLLNETRNIVCSSDFSFVLENCLDKATEILFDGLERNVFVDSQIGDGNVEKEVRIRLAGLLPGLSRWSSLALRALPNELVDNVLECREVPCLSGIIFSKFEERFR